MYSLHLGEDLIQRATHVRAGRGSTRRRLDVGWRERGPRRLLETVDREPEALERLLLRVGARAWSVHQLGEAAQAMHGVLQTVGEASYPLSHFTQGARNLQLSLE